MFTCHKELGDEALDRREGKLYESNTGQSIYTVFLNSIIAEFTPDFFLLIRTILLWQQ